MGVGSKEGWEWGWVARRGGSGGGEQGGVGVGVGSKEGWE